MKDFAKKLIPPYFYELVVKIIKKPAVFEPVWNALDYEPMNGVKIFFDPRGPWQKKMINNSYDSFLFDTLKNMDLEGKIIFDIGGHIGFHSLYFAKLVGEKGGVYYFEPNKKNFERFELILDKNKDLKERIKLFNVAISNTAGTEEFTTNDDIESGRSSGNFIEKADTVWTKEVYKNKGFIKSQVKTILLDSLEMNKLPDIIKIDVEGAEHLVLLGAKNILATKKPILFIEVHSIENMFNVVSLLKSLKYNMKILNKEQNGICYLQANPEK